MYRYLIVSVFLLISFVSSYTWGEELELTPLNSKASCSITANDVTAILNNFDISAYDADYNGLTYSKHVGKSASELANFNKQFKKKGFLSSYFDKDTAEKVIKISITQDAQRIANWVNHIDSTLSLKLEYDTSIPVGVVIRGIEENKAVKASKVIVILKKREGCKFIIRTSYPVINFKNKEYK